MEKTVLIKEVENMLNDLPDDDMVLDLAVRANCQYMVTYNTRDFPDVNQFGIEAITALEFLKNIEIL